jgi:hypothetical protein
MGRIGHAYTDDGGRPQASTDGSVGAVPERT